LIDHPASICPHPALRVRLSLRERIEVRVISVSKFHLADRVDGYDVACEMMCSAFAL